MFAIIYNEGVIERDYPFKVDALNASKKYTNVEVVNQNTKKFRLAEEKSRRK